MQLRQLGFQLAVRVIGSAGFGGGVIGNGFVLQVQQLAAHQAKVVNQRGTLGLHLPHFGAQVVQPQLVGVLDLIGFRSGGIHQLLCLGFGLVAGRNIHRLGFGLGVLLDLVGAHMGVGHNVLRLLACFLHDLFFAVFQRIAGIVQLTALDAQGGFGLVGTFLQFFFFFLQAAVLQPQNSHLVVQRMVALL